MYKYPVDGKKRNGSVGINNKRRGNNTDNDLCLYEHELQHSMDLLERELEALAQFEERDTSPSSITNGIEGFGDREQLLKENRDLRQILQRMRRRERGVAQDPQVLEIRNKAEAARKEAKEVAQEVKTLEGMKLLWRKGFEKVHANERSVTAIRGRQYEEQQELRVALRNATEELQTEEKRNTQLHLRFAALKMQVSMNVTEKEAAALVAKELKQQKKIEKLTKRAAELKSLRAAMFNDFSSLEFKEGRAKAKMEKDIFELKSLLLRRTKELEQIKKCN